MQFQADIADVATERPVDIESTGRGAAMLAGIGAGVCKHLAEVARMVALGTRFEPKMSASDRASHLGRWESAVRRTRSTL